MGPGRDASLAEVIREEAEWDQLEPLRRWSLDSYKEGFEGGEHMIQYADALL